MKPMIKKTEHPGLGETGKYHSSKDEEVLPEGTKLLINDVEPAEDAMCMKFFPDGNAAVAAIEFAAGEDVAGVRVSPLTGVLSSYEKE